MPGRWAFPRLRNDWLLFSRRAIRSTWPVRFCGCCSLPSLRGEHPAANRLGVYGIGLKRAIFKLGNKITVQSNTESGGFHVDIDVKQWAEEDENLDDWTFPLKRTSERVPKEQAGTKVHISQLRPEVIGRIEEGTLDTSLRKAISQTYFAFLGRRASVKLNGKLVEARPMPFGESALVEEYGEDNFECDGVDVRLRATLAPKRMRTQEYAGWYILCNGRTVVAANQTELTGWGVTTQAFHSKFLGFAGFALFTSDDPAKLPWTTTKRDLNRESLVYQKARNRMGGVAAPVLTFLSKMYPADPAPSIAERKVVESVVPGDLRQHLTSQGRRSFSARTPKVRKRTTQVRYEAEVSEIDRIRKHLHNPDMTASEVGRLTFDHYLKVECPE